MGIKGVQLTDIFVVGVSRRAEGDEATYPVLFNDDRRWFVWVV